MKKNKSLFLMICLFCLIYYRYFIDRNMSELLSISIFTLIGVVLLFLTNPYIENREFGRKFDSLLIKIKEDAIDVFLYVGYIIGFILAGSGIFTLGVQFI